MFTKRIFFGLLAILVIGGAVLTPSPKAYAAENGRIILTNNASGDPTIFGGMYACIGDEFTDYASFTTGSILTRDLTPGTYRIKVLRVIGAINTRVCTEDTTGDERVLFEQDVNISRNTITTLTATGNRVILNPSWNINYQVMSTSYPLGNNTVGVFNTSFDGNPFYPRLTDESPLCINGVLSYPTSRIPNVNFGAGVGYINVFTASQPNTSIAYGLAGYNIDRNCVMSSLYPAEYPRTVTINTSADSLNTPQSIYTVQLDESDSPDPFGKAVVGMNFSLVLNSALIDAPVVPVDPTPVTPTPTPTNTTPVATTPVAQTTTVASTTQTKTTTTNANKTPAKTTTKAPALIRTGGEEMNIGISMIIAAFILLMFMSVTFDKPESDDNNKSKRLKTSTNI